MAPYRTTTKIQIPSLRALSKHFLSSGRLGVATAALKSLFCAHRPLLKKLFLITNLTLL